MGVRGKKDISQYQKKSKFVQKDFYLSDVQLESITAFTCLDKPHTLQQLSIFRRIGPVLEQTILHDSKEVISILIRQKGR